MERKSQKTKIIVGSPADFERASAGYSGLGQLARCGGLPQWPPRQGRPLKRAPADEKELVAARHSRSSPFADLESWLHLTWVEVLAETASHTAVRVLASIEIHDGIETIWLPLGRGQRRTTKTTASPTWTSSYEKP